MLLLRCCLLGILVNETINDFDSLLIIRYTRGALLSVIFFRITFIIHLLINLSHLHPRPFVRLLHVAGNLALFAQRTGVVHLRPHHGKGALDSKLSGSSSPGPLLL